MVSVSDCPRLSVLSLGRLYFPLLLLLFGGWNKPAAPPGGQQSLERSLRPTSAPSEQMCSRGHCCVCIIILDSSPFFFFFFKLVKELQPSKFTIQQQWDHIRALNSWHLTHLMEPSHEPRKLEILKIIQILRNSRLMKYSAWTLEILEAALKTAVSNATLSALPPP